MDAHRHCASRPSVVRALHTPAEYPLTLFPLAGWSERGQERGGHRSGRSRPKASRRIAQNREAGATRVTSGNGLCASARLRIMLRHRLAMGISQTFRKLSSTLAGTAFALTTALPAPLPAQADSAIGNPLGRDPAAVEAGDALFHERCAVCHGQRAQGAMAADLVRTRTVTRGTEAALFRLIRRGIPGTEMPPQPDLEDNRIWQIVTYLRALALPGQQPPLEGDPEAGRTVFRQAGCESCHLVDGTGGYLGPPLDSIAVRKTSEQIRADVLEPDATLAEGFETVIAESSDGRKIDGILKNEDTFTLLVLAASGDVVTLRRDRLRSVTKPGRSRMPADYSTRLSAEDLGNLLAFLDRQRDPFVPVRRGFGNY